jgi:hypothetical protein
MMTKSVAFVTLLSLLVLQVTSQAPSCSSFSRCSECVYDSSDGVLSTPLPCSWCETTQTCLLFTDAATASCPILRNATLNPVCDDMQCAAAWTTNNLYFCRGTNISALFFALILVFINVLYYGWLVTIIQLPWQYQNINEVVDSWFSIEGTASMLKAFNVSSAPPVSSLRIKSASRTSSSCPICKMTMANPLGPGQVSFWCDVARYAFFPFFVGVTCNIVVLVVIFFLSVKPWFVDGYYAVMLTVPFVTYTLTALYIYFCRFSILGDTSQKCTTFVTLAILLRGRSIRRVFNMEDPDDNNSFKSAGTGSTTNKPPLSEKLVYEKKAETMRLLNSEDIETEFRRILEAEMLPDEFVLWWEKPRLEDVVMDNRWVIQSFVAALALGVWFWAASTVTGGGYAITLMWSSSSLATIGTLTFIISLMTLMMAVNACNRLYILTNKRLITLASGLFGAHMTYTDLAAVKYANILGYTELFSDPILTFSWEVPAGDRRMPPIKTNCFPAIADMQTFLESFRLVAPPLAPTESIRESIRHQRSVWRLHIFVNLLFIEVLPIILLYSQVVPSALGFFILVIAWFFFGGMLQRGLRFQQITISPLNLADMWVNWHGDENDMEQENFFERLVQDSSVAWAGRGEKRGDDSSDGFLSRIPDLARKIAHAAKRASFSQQPKQQLHAV